MKIDGRDVSLAQAYDLLESVGGDQHVLEATPDERRSLADYATLRAHRDYLQRLEEVRSRR